MLMARRNGDVEVSRPEFPNPLPAPLRRLKLMPPTMVSRQEEGPSRAAGSAQRWCGCRLALIDGPPRNLIPPSEARYMLHRTAPDRLRHGGGSDSSGTSPLSMVPMMRMRRERSFATSGIPAFRSRASSSSDFSPPGRLLRNPVPGHRPVNGIAGKQASARVRLSHLVKQIMADQKLPQW